MPESRSWSICKGLIRVSRFIAVTRARGAEGCPASAPRGRSRASLVHGEPPRSREDVAGSQAVHLADRMAEMGRVRIAGVERDVGQRGALPHVAQQAAGALPGPEGAEGQAGLLLEEVQEA